MSDYINFFINRVVMLSSIQQAPIFVYHAYQISSQLFTQKK